MPFKTAPPPSNPEKAAFAAGVAAEPRRVVKHLTQVTKQVLITIKVTYSVTRLALLPCSRNPFPKI